MAGFIDSGAPSLVPINGWFWPSVPTLNASYPTGGLVSPNNVLFPPDMMLALYWRVMQLEIDINVTVTPTGGGSPSTITFTQNSPVVDPGATPLTNEIQLVEGATVNPRFIGDLPDTTGTQHGVFFASFAGDAVVNGSNDLYPNFTFNVTNFAGAQLLSENPNLGPSSGVNLTIMGVHGVSDLVIPLYSDPAFTGVLTLSGACTLTANAFWPYNDAGNPLSDPPLGNVFDPTTGAQLITPAPQGL